MGPEAAGVRLDRLLTAKVPELSRTRLKALVLGGHVTVDGRPAAPSHRLRPGERVTLALPEPAPHVLAPAEPVAPIVYADDAILVVNKPRGVVVHPAPGHGDGTLVQGLVNQIDPDAGSPLRPGIVHRLDRDTTGLMVVARTGAAYQALVAAIARREVRRTYLAIVHGRMGTLEGRIEAAIGRDPRHRQRFAVVERGGRLAVTHFTVLERFADRTLVELVLETGRTHQIRVHLSAVGHPVEGDPVYGPDHRAAGQLLHAATLAFAHPVDGRPLRFQVDPPADFLDRLQHLRARMEGSWC